MSKQIIPVKKQVLDGSGNPIGHSVAETMMNKATSNALSVLEEIDPAQQTCLEFRVLLKVMSVSDVTEGGIFKPLQTLDKELFNKTKAEIVAVGDEAFTASDGSYIKNRPKPGDIVITAKYAGSTYRDKEFNLYRFCNDKDIVAIVQQ